MPSSLVDKTSAFLRRPARYTVEHMFIRQNIQTLRSNWKTLLDSYGVDYVVYNRGEALANVLATQSDWKLVYEDSETVIYVKS